MILLSVKYNDSHNNNIFDVNFMFLKFGCTNKEINFTRHTKVFKNILVRRNILKTHLNIESLNTK